MSLASGVLCAGELTGVRLSSGPFATRLVLDVDGPTGHQLLELSDPDRIVIDLPATAAIDNLILPSAKGRVRAVRTGARPGGELRIVLDLTEKSAPTSFALGPEGQFGHRIVIDLEAPGSAAAGRNASVSAASAAAPEASPAPIAAPVERTPEPAARIVDEYTGRDLVIAIDAGHGGRDSGAHHNNVREKDVVLQIARRLADLVEETPGFTAIMIRNDDRYIDLDERVRLARLAHADFFISIHADSHSSSSVNGATVYSIKTERAVRETEALLGNKQNAGQLVRSEQDLAEVDDTVARVLVELSRNASISNSRVAGEAIIRNLARVTTLLRTEVQQKSLAVLTSPDVPSLLVETAFVSNPREAAKLRDANFQQALAQAMFAGIVDFFRDHRPSDSYIARNPPPVERPPIRHVISRGETLSEIAERYRTSVPEIRRTNRINGDVIRVGQVLTIPTST